MSTVIGVRIGEDEVVVQQMDLTPIHTGERGRRISIHATVVVSLLSNLQLTLHEVDGLHTVSVFVTFRLRTVVDGWLHLAAKLGDSVFVVRSQHEQSLLYVLVWAGLVTVHCHGSVDVIVLVQAREPSDVDAGVATSEQVDEGLQLVTVVVPGSIGAGVGQTNIQWMPGVTEVKEQPLQISRVPRRIKVCFTDLGSQ